MLCQLMDDDARICVVNGRLTPGNRSFLGRSAVYEAATLAEYRTP
jgi:hypothetical protein